MRPGPDDPLWQKIVFIPLMVFWYVPAMWIIGKLERMR